MNGSQAISDEISKEAKRIEEDCIHSGKGHLNSSDIWNYVHYGIGVPATIFAALAAADVISSTSWNGLLAASAAALVAASTFINPSRNASEHSVAGNQYLALAKMSRRFRNIDLVNNDEAWVRSRLEELSVKRDELNENSPNPLPYAYTKAKEGIESGQALYETDKDVRK